MITTFTFGISVGRSWGLAEAMLKSNDAMTTPSSNKGKRTIRPKISTFNANHKQPAGGTSSSHYSSDDSSLMSQSSSSRKKGGNMASTLQVKSASLLNKEEDDKKKQIENDIVESIVDTVESAKETLLSNLELNLLPSAAPSASDGGGGSSEWKLVRTGYSSHIWLSKQRVRHNSSSEKPNRIMIKASCFSVLSVTDVALYLHENDITTGLECIFKHRTPLQTLKNKRVQVHRVAVSSTLAVAKRDFVAATYWLEIPETRSVVICTQSMPQAYSPKVKGVTRGTAYDS
jgi:hypothetical protein